jgi:geranylgeranyl transferase type-2 subunit alpha
LKRDERNFLCWGYRNYISELADPTGKADLPKSTEMIQRSLGNGSAWQLRARFLDSNPMEFDSTVELELVHNAIFTEPAEQSPWMYYRFLLGRFHFSDEDLNKELKLLEQLLEEEEGVAKWPLLACIQISSLLPSTRDRARDMTGKLQKLMEVDPMHVNFYRDVLERLNMDGDVTALVVNCRMAREVE